MGEGDKRYSNALNLKVEKNQIRPMAQTST